MPFFTWTALSNHMIRTSLGQPVRENVLWNTVKWSLSREQMSTVRLFMQRDFLQLMVQHFLCVISIVVGFFFEILYHIQFCILGNSICSYERALSFLPKAPSCTTMWFCLVGEVEGWGSCHWRTVFQGDTKVKQAWALTVVWSAVLGELWLSCKILIFF